jgi:HD-GYP domain-containing protein (c-di-GMP phosphodiesterase class II)
VVLGSGGKDTGVCIRKGSSRMKIPINALRAGFIFSKPVFIDDKNLLVPAGVEIREKDIEHLRAWGIATVETTGDIIGELSEDVPGPGKAVRGPADAGQPAVNASVAQATAGPVKAALIGRVIPEKQKIDIVFRNYQGIIKKIDDFFVQIASGAVPDARMVAVITDGLLQSIRDNRITTVGYILGSEVQSQELAKNSINTAILSALIAGEFEFSDQNMRQLIVGSLLHDVGMLRLPREILDKRGGLSPEETRQMQVHPFYSYNIIRGELKFSEDVGRIAIQHHERWDGEGYPRHFRGQEIAMGARIVSVVDAFEAMVSEKPYRNSMIGYQDMKNILSANSRRFDPDVLKAFVRIMGIYPIGSIIRLNTGAVARVTDVRGEAPLRPKIQIMIDEKGTDIRSRERKIFDLLKEKRLFITRALDPKMFAVQA